MPDIIKSHISQISIQKTWQTNRCKCYKVQKIHRYDLSFNTETLKNLPVAQFWHNKSMHNFIKWVLKYSNLFQLCIYVRPGFLRIFQLKQCIKRLNIEAVMYISYLPLSDTLKITKCKTMPHLLPYICLVITILTRVCYVFNVIFESLVNMSILISNMLNIDR